MKAFTALVDWPSAALTDSLVRKALATLQLPPFVISSLPEDIPSPENLLQWSTYDSINHGLSRSPLSVSRVLSSSYAIRKALIRKHYLSRCIHQYLAKHPNSSLRQAAPRTWDLELSFADELDEMWNDELYDLGLELDKAIPDLWWILKPGMADRGMGIRLFHTKNDLVKIFDEFEADNDADDDDDTEDQRHSGTAVVTSQLRHFVIQEYLSNPILVDPSEIPLSGQPNPLDPEELRGHKFHLRVYCVASGALTVYMCTRILALFSAVSYTPPEKYPSVDAVNEDLAAHLTNTSLQKERGEAGVRLLDELVGCRILSSSSANPECTRPQPHQQRPPNAVELVLDSHQICSRCKEQHSRLAQHPTLTAEDVQDLRTQISDVLAETFKAALGMSVHFQPIPNNFELFGVDFLVTHAQSPSSLRNFQVHLLEVNSEPAIELTGPRLTWILEDIFCAIGKVCVAPFFGSGPEPQEERDDVGQKWEVGETREALTKCLEVQVRGARGW
ncbi:tubulin-tyrosine ligase [Amylocystis lapponica]|nr:tubulin-tyrosine ligase [Amylocystis lapponica]